jgi:hypothetical protein
VHYNPSAHPDAADRQDLEYIELVNTSGVPVNLDGVQIAGFATEPYIFAGGQTLAPNERIIVARNPAVFQLVYGPHARLAPVGYGDRNLSNAGEHVVLVGPLGDTLQDFTFTDAAPWPAGADGNGPSLEIINPLGDPADENNWRASYSSFGSPGVAGIPNFNGNASVDAPDLTVWKTGFGTTVGATRSQGDADGNQRVDGNDFLAWQRALGDVGSPLAAMAAGASAPTLAELQPALPTVEATRPVDSAFNDGAAAFSPSWIEPLYFEPRGKAPFGQRGERPDGPGITGNWRGDPDVAMPAELTDAKGRERQRLVAWKPAESCQLPTTRALRIKTAELSGDSSLHASSATELLDLAFAEWTL